MIISKLKVIIESNTCGLWEGSVGRGTCSQDWRPEFKLLQAHGGRKRTDFHNLSPDLHSFS